MLTVREGETFDWVNIPLFDCLRGNALDAHYTLRVHDKLKDKLAEIGNLKLMEKLLVPLASEFSQVEHQGMAVDLSVVDAVGEAIQTKIEIATKEVREVCGLDEEINLKSTKDLREILYSSENLGLYPAGMTKKKEASTDKETLNTMLSYIEEELESRAK